MLSLPGELVSCAKGEYAGACPVKGIGDEKPSGVPFE